MLPSQPNCDPAPHGLPSCSCSGHRRPDIASSKGGETLSLLQSLPPSVRQSRAQGAAQPTRNRPPPRGQVPLLQRAAATPRPGVCSSPRVPAGPFEAALPCKTSLRSSLPSNLPPAGTLPPPARQYRLTLSPPRLKNSNSCWVASHFHVVNLICQRTEAIPLGPYLFLRVPRLFPFPTTLPGIISSALPLLLIRSSSDPRRRHCWSQWEPNRKKGGAGGGSGRGGEALDCSPHSEAASAGPGGSAGPEKRRALG